MNELDMEAARRTQRVLAATPDPRRRRIYEKNLRSTSAARGLEEERGTIELEKRKANEKESCTPQNEMRWLEKEINEIKMTGKKLPHAHVSVYILSGPE